MKKSKLLVGILMILFFSVLFSVMTFTEGKAKSFKTPFEKENRPNLTEDIMQKAFDNSSKELKVIVEFEGRSIRNKKNLEISNTLNIEDRKIGRNIGKNSKVMLINSEDYSNLKKNNLIKKIYFSKEYKIDLQDSVPLINATTTWQRQISGVNFTGRGQTICIIDTGVNYSHPDLGECYGNNNASSACKVVGGWDFCSSSATCTNSEDSDPMDVQGHGTHVSGIAAANGSIKGVAPDAKIVMIKASNNTGTFWDVELQLGIEWCVNHAPEFNISVISMSLGGGLYNNYCDNQEDPLDLTGTINLAVANNISVVVASGNGETINAISSPGCIQNATPVTSSPKSDNSISIFANTWNDSSMLILDAPGENINSTTKTGDYGSWNGTSMATPHVAGAIAIINQYLKLGEQSRTPQEIENILNSTGKQIYDSYSRRYFSRIDVYSAIRSLCSENIVNTTWQNLDNVSICRQNNTILTNFSRVEYDSNNCGFTSNITYSIVNESSCDFCSPNWTAITTGETIWYNDSNNCYTATNLSEDNNSRPTNITINITSNNKTEFLNNNLELLMEINFNITNNLNISRQFHIIQQNSSSNFSFTIIKNLTFEQDNGWTKTVYLNNTLNSGLICIKDIEIDSIDNFSVNCDGDGEYLVNTCPKIIDNYSCEISGGKYKILGLRHSGVKEQELFCGDSICTSSTESCSSCSSDCGSCLVSPRGGGGSGGGGGTSQTYIISESNLSEGISQKLSPGSKLGFIISGINHTVAVKTVNKNNASFVIRSEPINITLNIGEETKLNLTSQNYFDLYIKLENISNGKATIALQKIFETRPEFLSTNKGKEYEIMNETNKTGNNLAVQVAQENILKILAGIVLLGLIIYLIKSKVFYTKKTSKSNGTQKDKITS